MTGPRRHLLVSRRPSYEASGRLLLLALALDRPDGHPDNLAATARLLGSSEQAVRDWRRTLLADGILERRAGFLVAGPALPEWRRRAEADFAARGLRYGHDPVPRAFLARAASPSILHAAAVVYGDAVGWERERRFIRTDAERAALANASRPTVRAARAALEAAGLVAVEALRRGRAPLRRVVIKPGGRATWGSPMGPARAASLASKAERHRVALSTFAPSNEARGTPQQIASGTPQQIASLHQVPSGLPTIKAETGLTRKDGWPASRKPDGGQKQKTETRNRCAAWFGDRANVERFLKLAARRPEHACRELLALAGCFDRSRKRATEWPAAIVRRWRDDAPVLLLGVVADVVAGVGRNFAANIGAVVATRLPRLLAGKATDALSDRMKARPLADIVSAAAAGGSIARTA
jgi:hypothetical protein